MWLGGMLGRSGVSATFLTLISLGTAAAAGVAVALHAFGVAAVLLLVSGACDVLDGVVARATNSASRFGALLDSTVDRFADALPLVGMLVAFRDSEWAAAVIGITLVMNHSVSYVRARAEGLGASLPVLFMRRAERLVLLVVALVFGHLLVFGVPFALIAVTALGLLSSVGVVVALWAARVALADVSVPKPSGR
jgi:CDP-diacylglycerol--glycerol-3-phosphate 3-phosphatidyltransferase